MEGRNPLLQYIYIYIYTTSLLSIRWNRGGDSRSKWNILMYLYFLFVIYIYIYINIHKTLTIDWLVVYHEANKITWITTTSTTRTTIYIYIYIYIYTHGCIGHDVHFTTDCIESATVSRSKNPKRACFRTTGMQNHDRIY